MRKISKGITGGNVHYNLTLMEEQRGGENLCQFKCPNSYCCTKGAVIFLYKSGPCLLSHLNLKNTTYFSQFPN